MTVNGCGKCVGRIIVIGFKENVLKTFMGIGKKEVLYRVYVVAKTKTEAIHKIRSGDIIRSFIINEEKGFALGGGGTANIKEVD